MAIKQLIINKRAPDCYDVDYFNESFGLLHEERAQIVEFLQKMIDCCVRLTNKITVCHCGPASEQSIKKIQFTIGDD